MKLEIDIDEYYYKIICKRVEENKPYHSPYEYEVIADGKPLEQEPQSFEWCDTCKEYDQENHCCHRWSKVIRNTVEEMKQEYIEREVLDKVRDQLKSNLRGVEITLEVLVENDPLRPKMEGAKCTLEDCLELIDMVEPQESEG